MSEPINLNELREHMNDDSAWSGYISPEIVLALIDAAEAARGIAGLSSGAWPELSDALARFDFGSEGS